MRACSSVVERHPFKVSVEGSIPSRPSIPTRVVIIRFIIKRIFGNIRAYMKNYFNLLIKIDRVSAWVLFASMLLYFITGYGMTKGIISASFATKLHLDILPIIVIIAFTIHTYFAIHLAFKRWRIWNPFTKVILFAFYAAFLIFFGYIEIFYPGKFKANNQPSLTPQINAPKGEDDEDETILAPQKSSTSQSKIFTRTELAKFNGQNGQPAYLAVDGVVYDLSSVFVNGKHFQHMAGQELSNAFNSQHIKSQITKYPVVGKLQ